MGQGIDRAAFVWHGDRSRENGGGYCLAMAMRRRSSGSIRWS